MKKFVIILISLLSLIKVGYSQDLSATGDILNADSVLKSIDLSVTGGVEPYTYLWNTGATTQDISDLYGGFYSVVVTDAVDSTYSIEFEVNVGVDLIIDTVYVMSYYSDKYGYYVYDNDFDTRWVSYEEDSSWVMLKLNDLTEINRILTYAIPKTRLYYYSIDVSVDSVSWDRVVVADTTTSDTYVDVDTIAATSCRYVRYVCSGNDDETYYDWTALAEFRVLNDDSDGSGDYPEITIDSVYNTSGSDGGIFISVEGGESPYTYLWSNEATTQDITGLTAGEYSVIVTDDNEYSVYDTVVLRSYILDTITAGEHTTLGAWANLVNDAIQEYNERTSSDLDTLRIGNVQTKLEWRNIVNDFIQKFPDIANDTVFTPNYNFNEFRVRVNKAIRKEEITY